jgi:hypothetical protein
VSVALLLVDVVVGAVDDDVEEGDTSAIRLTVGHPLHSTATSSKAASRLTMWALSYYSGGLTDVCGMLTQMPAT